MRDSQEYDLTRFHGMLDSVQNLSLIFFSRIFQIKISHLQLKYLNPFQKNVGEILYNFKNVLVPELNLGQLSRVLRAKYLVPALTLSKVQGLPFKFVEIENKIDEILGTTR